MVRSLEEIQKEKEAHSRKPLRLFLWLAAFMVLLSVLAYTFEAWLFEMTRTQSTFVVAISAPLVAALFFLYCYRTPRLGKKLLGYGAEVGELKDGATSVTYDIFQAETGTDDVVRNLRRHEARRMRKKSARMTASDTAAKPEHQTDEAQDSQ